MPFRHPWLWGLAMLLAFLLASADLWPIKVAGILLCGLATASLYRAPDTPPAALDWHTREVPLYRGMWNWLAAKPDWMRRLLAGVGPSILLGLYASSR